MGKYDWLKPELERILRSKRGCYWLSYQIYENLRPDARAQLEKECGNKAVGRGGGYPYGPATAISQILARWTPEGKIDVKKLNGSGLEAFGREATIQSGMGIFRWMR